MVMNEVLDKLPKHLMNFVIDQPYNEYTAQDHAVWRYVMKQNVRYLSKVAHDSYLDGLKQTGISIEQIPRMYGMNRILKKIGWAAVAVDGFIPPAAFMEFQAYNVLVIAADIRPIDQIEYTPAPDIIHEAAGHAPIIADPEYAAYLKKFGYYGSKAFSSAKDFQIYNAIRHLSILKADPYTSQKEIKEAEKHLSELEESNLGRASEMAQIRNLHWWTVEYGLIGSLDKPKIYGAGLLSSIGESYNCLQDDVVKLPYSIDAITYCFDITEQQPQLFVTPDFAHLTNVLEEFADTMALRRGGLYGIEKAIESANLATVEYNSGLQISGTFTDVISIEKEPVYLKATGPASLNYNNRQLEGQGKEYHKEGFGSPVGKLNHNSKPLELMTDGDLAATGIEKGINCRLEFESGIKVEGLLKNIIRKEGKNLVMTFENCSVTFRGESLFRPEWGIYDMAVGQSVTSAYNGPADPDSWGLTFPAPEEKTHKILHSENNRRLYSLYQKVREIRETGKSNGELKDVWQALKEQFPEDWLLPMEILELLHNDKSGMNLFDEIKDFLVHFRDTHEGFDNLINNGFQMIGTGTEMETV